MTTAKRGKQTKSRTKPPVVYFLGAGASRADGLPLTHELNYCIAAHLRTRKGANGVLAKYYDEVYSVEPKQLKQCASVWKRFLQDRNRRLDVMNPLPDLIETLSILDLMIADELSVGASRSSSRKKTYEADATVLAQVRRELVMAIGLQLQEAIFYHQTPCAKALIGRLNPQDSIVTTNWDTLVDRALSSRRRTVEKNKWLTATNINYGCVAERLVNWRGQDIKKRTRTVVNLFKLHGSLNWFHCPCCGNLYANVEGNWIIDSKKRRPRHDYCHCNAGLENVVVVPSFVKEYRNTHLRSVWQHALKVLKASSRWVFVGYSLPSDDYHIRALLLRAFRARNASGRSRSGPAVRITVVTDSADEDKRDRLKARYEELFRASKVTVFDEGFANYLKVQQP